MIRWILFLAIATALVGYAFWIYLRVDLAVPGARRLAVVRALALLVVLTLLFDVRLPVGGAAGVATRWVLLDASLSMGAAATGGPSAWDDASARAETLSAAGWHVATFGATPPRSTPADSVPSEVATLLGPALQRAAEAGARAVTVLSDQRFEDEVAVRSALETLPIDVSFERFGGDVPNAGVTRLDVDDFAQPDDDGSAEVEVHGGVAGEQLTVEILEEGSVVASARAVAPAPGLRTRLTVELPPPSGEGRVRYSAVVRYGGDAYPQDDAAVDYAAVGRQEGALVVLSLSPDWEPRYLLPVLRDVTGLPTVGYLRAGPDRFVQAGRAVDRAGPVDSATVRRAVTDAALLVVHGMQGDIDRWTESQLTRPGRKILMVGDVPGASLAGVEAAPPRAGEWYVSADVPSSPVAGSLAGAALQGLPPLTGLMVASVPEGSAPLLVQLRGAGEPLPALHLEQRPTGRVAVVLASGFWRWAARESGRDAYRRLWSGVLGWLLADQTMLAAETRPAQWVVPRGEPVVWNVPTDAGGARLVVEPSGPDGAVGAPRAPGGDPVVDTVLASGGRVSTGMLPPGSYAYRVEGPAGDTLSAGRFDVAAASGEMLPEPVEPPARPQGAGIAGAQSRTGTPLRTLPWPYLLVIALLCGEWVGRRRSGLR